MKDFIYELIPKDRYITRSELVELTKLSDRLNGINANGQMSIFTDFDKVKEE